MKYVEYSYGLFSCQHKNSLKNPHTFLVKTGSNSVVITDLKNRINYIDTLIISLSSFAVIFGMMPEKGVILLLTFIIGTSILLITSDKFWDIANIFIMLFSIPINEAFVLVPVSFYLSSALKHKLSIFIGLFRIALLLLENGFRENISIIILVAFSMLLGRRSEELLSKSKQLKDTRDNDAELTNALAQKNLSLLQKQDDEIKIATLKERNRIAREIHDNVGHLLSRALLQAGACLAVTDKEKMPVQYAQTSAMKETLSSAMNSIRESVHGLRDDSIDLHHAIKEAVGSVSSKFKVQTELDFSEKMPPDVKLSFIAIIKEALSNSVKYSDGDTIRIVIREHPALYQLYINDNGKTSEIKHEGGMGLNNMRERTEALGGFFRIDTSDGFRIFVSVKRKTEEKNENNNS